MSAGWRQPCSAQARRNGVNTLNGSPSDLRTRPGATAYGEPVRTSSRSSSASALATASSRGGPVRAEVGGDVHGCGVHGGRDLGHDVGRVAPHDEQLPAERGVEVAQRAVEEGAPGRAGRVEQRRVEHEQRQAPARPLGGGQEHRLVAHPQVAPEPDDGVLGHGLGR